jgi:DNA-binding response OmpR family regulator
MNDIKKSILHVEDDTDFHAYVDTLLEDIAHITSVPSAKEFGELVSGFKFDLFLLDLVLKDGSGSSMARKLRLDFPNTPIVILSAHDVTGAIEEADAIFTKGKFSVADFIHTIKKLLR